MALHGCRSNAARADRDAAHAVDGVFQLLQLCDRRRHGAGCRRLHAVPRAFCLRRHSAVGVVRAGADFLQAAGRRLFGGSPAFLGHDRGGVHRGLDRAGVGTGVRNFNRRHFYRADVRNGRRHAVGTLGQVLHAALCFLCAAEQLVEEVHHSTHAVSYPADDRADHIGDDGQYLADHL